MMSMVMLYGLSALIEKADINNWQLLLLCSFTYSTIVIVLYLLFCFQEEQIK